MKKRLLSLALALVMCLSLLPPTVFAAVGGTVAINDTNFPDTHFRDYVRTLPGAEDNIFTQKELAAITEINCSFTGEFGPTPIFFLTGIEHFTALTRLNVNKNVIVDLDLSKNTKLTELHCSHNGMESLKLGNTDKLKYLDCSENRLIALDVSQQTALTYLDCRFNRLQSLDVSQNTALTDLNCNKNQLTGLDLSHNPRLNTLVCYDNQLKSLELGNTDKLVTLDCHNNQLTSLDVSRHTALTDLDCSNNQLKSLELGNTAKLVTLDCHNNQLTSLDVSQNTALTDLNCSKNQLKSLELGNTAKLGRLDCRINQLTSLDVSQHTALTYLNCSTNQLKSLELGNTAKLEDLYCHENQLTSLDLSKNAALTLLLFYDNQLICLDLSHNPQLQRYSIDSNQRTVATGTALAALDPTFDPDKASRIEGGIFKGGKVYFTADELTYVYDCGLGKTISFKLVNATPQNLAIYNRYFPDKNFLAYVNTLPGAEDGSFTPEELAAITEINCNGGGKAVKDKIANLTGIEHFSALTKLDCSDNQLTKPDFSKNTALKSLNCSFNLLNELDLSQNTSLEHLTAVQSLLTSLNLGNNINLSYLDVGTNRLTSLDLSQSPKLTELHCRVNQLTGLDLSQNPQLTHLDCDNNQLISLDLSRNSQLTHLDCYRNKLTSLDLRQNPQLTYLYCEDNQLTSLDLSQNPKLTQLYSDGNRRTVANGTAMATIDPNFDPAKVGNIVDGSFDDGKVYFTADELIYSYDCGNGKTAYFALIKAPQRLAIDGTNFPDKNFQAYLKTLPGAEDNIFTDADLAAITEIDCNGENKPEEEKIADLTGIEHFIALTKLNCSCNKLTELDVSKNIKLTQLSCSENSLTSLDLSRNPQLTQLYCDGNRRTVAKGTELAAMDPNLDPAKVGNVVDGSFYGGKVYFTADELTYSYDCGNGHTASFKLCKTPPVITMSTITFQVVNGTWADGSTTEKTAMVTMYDGFGTLYPEQVPAGMTANKGFEGGAWNVTPNTEENGITGNVTYTYSFKAKPTLPFVDVTLDDWFYEGVRYTTTRGLFKGISRTEFGPALPMTRSMVVQVLYSMAGKPKVEKTNQFVDVKDSDWFADAVAWGVKNGVTAGYPGGRFAPDDKVNREQLAVMLHGYMEKPAATEPLTFADNDAISSWARNAVQWAVENHLMGGVPGNKILPQGPAERSQGAVIMMNFDQMPKQ